MLDRILFRFNVLQVISIDVVRPGPRGASLFFQDGLGHDVVLMEMAGIQRIDLYKPPLV